MSWLTPAEAAAEKRVSPETIRRWAAEGRVVAQRVGPKLIRIESSSLESMGTPLAADEGAA